MADSGGDPWAFSRKGKLGGSEVFSGGHGGHHSPIILKLRESWSREGHAAREMVTVYSVTLYICDSILLLLAVGQIVRTPLLPRTESVSAHIR